MNPSRVLWQTKYFEKLVNVNLWSHPHPNPCFAKIIPLNMSRPPPHSLKTPPGSSPELGGHFQGREGLILSILVPLKHYSNIVECKSTFGSNLFDIKTVFSPTDTPTTFLLTVYCPPDTSWPPWPVAQRSADCCEGRVFDCSPITFLSKYQSLFALSGYVYFFLTIFGEIFPEYLLVSLASER